MSETSSGVTDSTDDVGGQDIADDDAESVPSHREGIALCLSGGGFRAALFHLGALRRLNELGILSRIDAFSSVSGGSILAGFLATRVGTWPAAGKAVADWDDIAAEFRAFVSRDARTMPVLKRYALPWNWVRRDTQAKSLAAHYEALTHGATLASLPEQPRFVLCATELTNGTNWIFERRRVGSYKSGYRTTAANCPLSFAMAASSCFPPVFSPMRLPDSLARKPSKIDSDRSTDAWKGLRLSDGGVYDNLGLEPIWKAYRTIFVSDGGGLFRNDDSTAFHRQWRRLVDIYGHQVAALRRRWLIACYEQGTYDGTYWGIGSGTRSLSETGTLSYTTALSRDHIACIRTDLDAFTEAEMAILENHGYMRAHAAVTKRTSHLVDHSAAPFKVPYPEWLDEERVRRALAHSQPHLSARRIWESWGDAAPPAAETATHAGSFVRAERPERR